MSKAQMDSFNDQMETLTENFEELKMQVSKNVDAIGDIGSKFDLKAQEGTIAHYLEIIATSLQKEVGEKPYSNKMGQNNVMEKFYLSEDSLKLKNAVEKLGDKF